RQAGGSVSVETAPGQGSTFRVYYPVTDERLAPAAGAQRLPEAGNRQVILVVEDEDAVRSLTKRMLTEAGYTVYEARDGRDALDVADRLGSIDLVVSDLV